MTAWEGLVTSVCHKGSVIAANPLFGRIKGMAQGHGGRGQCCFPSGRAWVGGGEPRPHRGRSRAGLTSATNYRKPEPLKQQEFIFSQFWRPQSEMQALAGTSPSKVLGETSRLFQLLGVLGAPWLVAASLRPACVSVWPFSPCVAASVSPPLRRTLVTVSRAHPGHPG